MIKLENVSKIYDTTQGPTKVLEDVTLTIPKEAKLGLLGRNGAGKSTMIRLISGAERPTLGRITRSMTVSWPIAFGGAFQTSLSGMDNVRFICRIYGKEVWGAREFIQDFAELGKYIDEPVRTYSSGMKARLAFALSLLIEFDCFLIDEVIAVGDARFHQRCLDELFEKRSKRSKIIVSHDTALIEAFCDSAAILKDGKLIFFEDIKQSVEFYRGL